MSEHKILIIDDEPAQVQVLAGFLKKKGFDIEKAHAGLEGLKILEKKPIDLIITDFKMPDIDGIEVLKRAKAINPEVDVIMMTAFGSIESATEAMRAGAIDYLTKPVDLDQLEILIHKALEHQQLVSENRLLREQLAAKFKFDQIISASEAMEEALNLAGRAAPSKATVLITGESGTGKELIAKAIHYASPRKDQPFVAVNCAALAENLLESELFGHEKGAFTGADRQRKGRFELANHGTLFIDEVGEIPLTTQVKLLRVLQEQTFERVGGTETIKVDVRIVAATNRDLEELIEEGRFREDLFYRLNVVRINVPPLRKRKSDIPLLVDYFLKKYSAENNKKVMGISKEAMDLLMKYDYPGNVRELENIIEQSVVLCRTDIIMVRDLPMTVRGMRPESKKVDPFGEGTFIERVEAFEKALIAQAMEQAQGVQTQAARILGITERHLRYKLQKYGMK
ncbi:MAG: sigma-54 dependent transcriptional regulator [candidate division KSB1 bacterium]|nr:sigma-54 dependent transcriptional regulator [candidate division KSB1 bacterium]MDZ7335520.1 sigma-54 dependent transcriptional regulator [candidate division KSB1 bacterium]MDZ7357099.1 sigma-54 dependent transcriptional regulator [candidate division KSB1 bacterium]MDZ7401777.1 sigma-54 dependent transcriptional regulator [candidate division KSB1 bacterium]